MVAQTGLPGKKFDLARTSTIHATANGLWPLVTDLSRWPGWFRNARGAGLETVEALAVPPGTVDPLQPELGKRYKLTFTNGLEGEFRVTYWLEPAQISLGLVKGTAKNSHGIEGMILDLDLFPRPGDVTQLWFCALVMMERGVHPSLLARWPKREVQSWVDGFHAHLVAQGPGLARGIKTRKQAEQALSRPA